MAFVALACIAGWLFIKLTWDLLENDLVSIDRTILLLIGKMRVARLNGPAVDVTALGSPTIAFLLCAVGIAVLLLERDRFGAVFLLLSAAGAALGSLFIKLLIRRERPSVISHLVEVTDFSYPSGHTIISTALFLTFALLASRHYAGWKARATIFIIAGALICLVAFSRLYLGVHYPSDVLSGTFFGAAWTFGLAAALFSRRRLETRQKK